MNKLNLILGILIGITIISCSSDDNPITNNNNNSEKKITKSTYLNLNNQSVFIESVVYDNNDNIIETTGNNGLILSSYFYNSSDILIKKEFNEYENQTLYFKEVDNISYNNDNKISNIEHTGIIYNSDGSISNQNTTNYNITYGNNSITSLSDDFANTKIEYILSNNLITGIKVFRNNTLKSDMSFAYDAGGNCLSGSGPIDEGSLDSTTNDIELSVSYGTKEKNLVFNTFFNFEILTRTSFYNIRQVLINQQGNKYVEEIQWYQYGDYSYKETYENSFDSDGYIISKTLSEFPDYPNNSMITYIWE